MIVIMGKPNKNAIVSGEWRPHSIFLGSIQAAEQLCKDESSKGPLGLDLKPVKVSLLIEQTDEVKQKITPEWGC